MVVAQAAAGLGRIGDSRAISSIVEAAAVSPKELALAFARALVYFEDPEADAAARRLIDDDAVFQELRSAAKSEKAKIHSDKALFERN
jgi:HEAT repeat protein